MRRRYKNFGPRAIYLTKTNKTNTCRNLFGLPQNFEKIKIYSKKFSFGITVFFGCIKSKEVFFSSVIQFQERDPVEKLRLDIKKYSFLGKIRSFFKNYMKIRF